MSNQEKINTVIKHLEDEFPNCEVADKYDSDYRAQLFRIDDGENISLLRIQKSFFEDHNVSQITMWLNNTSIAKQLAPETKVIVTIDTKGNSTITTQHK